MKNAKMKYTINSLGWIGLILSILACLSFTSCKKENITTNSNNTIITNNTKIHYVLVSPRQSTEANSFDIINGNKIKQPFISTIYDTITMKFPHFYGPIMQGALNIEGYGVTIKDTIWLSFDCLQAVDGILSSSVNNAKYVKY